MFVGKRCVQHLAQSEQINKVLGQLRSNCGSKFANEQIMKVSWLHKTSVSLDAKLISQ